MTLWKRRKEPTLPEPLPDASEGVQQAPSAPDGPLRWSDLPTPDEPTNLDTELPDV